MDLIIHETGIELIKRKEIKNNAILDFINSDIYFKLPGFEKDYYRPLDIFDGIEIENLDDKFFISWHIIDFKKIYIKRLNAFYEKITSLIKDMKDFGLLFKFFIFNNQKDYESEVIKIMKKKYMELLPNYSPERCPKFLDDTIKLIHLLDEKKLETKDLLESIQKGLDHEKVNELYIKLSDKHKLDEKTKASIVTYFTSDENKSNPSSLVYLIKNCKNLKNDIFSKINRYIITELDFLSTEENDSFKLFKGLIDNKIIDMEFLNKGQNYATKIQITISSLFGKINNLEIKYIIKSIKFLIDYKILLLS